LWAGKILFLCGTFCLIDLSFMVIVFDLINFHDMIMVSSWSSQSLILRRVAGKYGRCGSNPGRIAVLATLRRLYCGLISIISWFSFIYSGLIDLSFIVIEFDLTNFHDMITV